MSYRETLCQSDVEADKTVRKTNASVFDVEVAFV